MEALRAAFGLGVVVFIAWVVYYGVISVVDLIGDRVFGRQGHKR